MMSVRPARLDTMKRRHATAPGRVNLIGDHTDYTGGLCLPMAIDMGTTIIGTVTNGHAVQLRSADEELPAMVAIDVVDPSAATPDWARYVAGVVHEIRPRNGFDGDVTTTIPIGAGLSSSAAFEVALALALGFEGSILELARLCQRAENLSSGVPSGILDQLSSAGGRAGKAMIMDCHDLSLTYVDVPNDADIVVIHSGQERTLAGSEYPTRVAQCAAAEAVIGPLRTATLADAESIDDPVVRRRARHVVTENQRVRDFARALSSGNLGEAGSIMTESHCSLRDDYETSTPIVDALIDELRETRGVFGARITGGGFGGCVVALAEPGSLTRGWVVHPAEGARLH
jgi:galactokinase